MATHGFYHDFDRTVAYAEVSPAPTPDAFAPGGPTSANAMPGTIQTTLADELRTDARRLDAACQDHFGVSGDMFRTAKFLFYITTLIFTGYVIEAAGVQPFTAMLFAAVLITGPEGVEAYLIRQGVIADPAQECDD